MATLLLQAAGAYLGGFLGAAGVTIGTAAGGIAGYLVDRMLFGAQGREGPRLAAAPPFTAEEGAPIPRLYGTARLGGTLVWATRFEETRAKERQGGKGGPRVTTYAYHANLAFALCEGEIAGLRRVWADGKELDLDGITLRVHRGTQDQAPDPLIEAKQGEGNAPAYRGVAYVVFERLALEDFGNRIPQLQFEVLRPVGALREKVRAVALIPGSTEFGYLPGQVTAAIGDGEGSNVNRHVLFAASDFEASIDELQAVCPGLRHVALVVSWFGDDLRAGACRIRPAVSDHDAPGVAAHWRVGGMTGGDAPVVSASGGRPAYGGTPSDHTVVAAIQDLKARGLEVTLYPFIMMDVADDNDLPDPYGGESQAAYPWRGRITCHPGPGAEDSADRSAAARAQVADFLGGAEAADFTVVDGELTYGGDAGDWGYRRLVLHYAKLAQLAGGVDAFLVGSELRGLTTLRDGADAFPFVEGLCALAADVRAVLGSGTKLTYGADWTEYFGHQPADGSGDIFFHLDPLWAHAAIDAVGIDNYMPLSDWRDGDHDGSNPDGAAGPYDLAALRAAIAGSERFDWHYPDAAARLARERAPIEDGAYGKPWVFRVKDLAGWWGNPHHDRPGGVEAATPTAWVPRSKPIWFTELGCPACDKGPNQPNVFFDPKSSESFLPHFSNGGRSDLAQRRFLAAHFAHWDDEGADFDEGANPESDLFDGRMVDFERVYLWAWDCRPFPAFPLALDIWGDGGNWALGHWLNGRLANPTAGDVINAVLADHGLPAAHVDGASGSMVGFVVTEPAPARAAIEPIADVFGLAVYETAERLVARDEGGAAGPALALAEIVSPERGPVTSVAREPAHQLPGEATLSFRDPMRDYQNAAERQARPDAASARQESLWFSGALEPAFGRALAADWLRRRWRGRETVAFALPPNERRVGAGSLVRLPGGQDDFLVTAVEEGVAREVRARRVDRLAPTPVAAGIEGMIARAPTPSAAPLVHFLDLPTTGAADEPHRQLRVAAWARPWRSHLVYASPETTGFSERAVLANPATVGTLEEGLAPGPVGRIDRRNAAVVRLRGGELSSVSRTRLLNGANAAAISCGDGGWEVMQFETADEIAAGVWRLTRLLRGQLGTEDAMHAGAGAGAAFVMLDEAVAPAGLEASEVGLPLHWRIGPGGADFGGPAFAAKVAAGGLRAALPLSPAHLRARRLGDGGVALSWIRRGRLSADSWEAAEIPLGEEAEAYRVEIRDGGALVRAAETGAPNWTYTAAMIAADFGGSPGVATVAVAQRKGPGGTAGPAATLDLALD